MDLCEEIYRFTESFPKREVFGLIAQLRSSGLSVPSNIVGRVASAESALEGYIRYVGKLRR